MPQIDRHRERTVPIEFESNETFQSMPYDERLTLVLITYGYASFILNGKAITLNAPCIMLLSPNDNIQLVDKNRLSAKSFSFNPKFLNSHFSFDALKEDKFVELEVQHDRNMVIMFTRRNDKYTGYLDVPAAAYLRISEWIAIIETETFAQSDGQWTCRIRRYLLQTLYLIDDIYHDQASNKNTKITKSAVDITMEYIHVNYPNSICLEDLCRRANTNRTSLNRNFKAKTGCTAIEYLVNYRIKISCEALTHTNLSIAEISEATGFAYDTYFIKQFTKKMGMTPTEYRNIAHKKMASC